MPLFGSPAWHLGALPARLVGSYGGAGGFAGTVANLTATGGAQQIALDWDDTPGATRYEVQRSADGLAGWATLDDAVATSDYTDTGLADATTYYYRVRAGDASSWGPWSGVVSDATDAPFSPSDIAGLVLWLDASEGTYQSTGGSAALADGDPVGEWQDQSGEGNDATQTTGAAKPVLKTGANGLNGLPVLRFDGTDDCLFAAFTLAQPAQVFIVYKSLAIGTSGFNDGIFDGGTGVANMALLADNTPRTVLFAGVSLVYTANVCDGAFGQVTALFNGASSVLREDGTARATGDAGSADPGGFTVGALTTGGRCTNIDVAEILVYDSALSDTDREAVEAYLTDRYGL